jgi:tRNA A37 threonylcarbamoyladenosine biosynthesis protein TsaE
MEKDASNGTKVTTKEKEHKGFKSSSYVNKDHFFLKNLFKEKHPDTPCLVEYEAQGVTHSDLERLRKFTRRRKQKLDSIKYLPSNIPHFTLNTSMDKRGKITCNERTGLFLVNLKDGEETRQIYLLKRLIGSGKSTFVQSLYCTDFETQKVFLRLNKQRKKASGKPQLGIFEGNTSQSPLGGSVLQYNKLKVPTPPVMHQNHHKVTESVENYFANTERYLRNGKSGSKRVLMYGNAGSGKTTLAYQIAKKYEKTHCVFFATSILAISLHSELCARYKIPTIIIAEECDKWMGSVDHEGRADGNVKAFLDGYMSHRNTSGEFTLLITNYPEKIEKTIIFRPGRIHERILIGPLDADHALKVAKHYFKDEKGKALCPAKELKCLGEMSLTGAQIENVATMCVDAVNGTDEKITERLIKRVIEEFSEAVSHVKNYSDEKTIVENSWSRSLGFDNV